MSEKLDILAIGVHPDDIELGCAGTILKHIHLGFSVGAIDLTRGELGTRGSADLRLKEAAKASDILGLKMRVNLAFEDGFVFAENREYQMELVRQIRKFQPDIILCNAVDDRHPDHPQSAELVERACFLAGLPKIETRFDGTTQEVWRPKRVYHYIQWKALKPDFVVDISNFIEGKVEVVKAYGSQFYDPNSEEPETVISSRQFTESVSFRAADLGRLIGVDYAEGFTSSNLLGVERLDHLI